MDYILKNALLDTLILSSSILVLFLSFHFLSKNVSPKSLVGRSKSWAKRITIFSVASIVFFALILVLMGINLGFIASKIMIYSVLIIPFLVLSTLVLASLTHRSARIRLLSLFKNRYMSVLYSALTLALTGLIFVFSHFVKFVLSNLDGVDIKDSVNKTEESEYDKFLLGKPGKNGYIYPFGDPFDKNK